LAWHADRDVVGDFVSGVGRSTVVAIGFVISWSNHIWT
jgi:hypothetical protein